MIRAGELSLPAVPAPREPYWKARLRELRETGLAMPRPRPSYTPPPASAACVLHRSVRRFQRELARARILDVFWVPDEERMTVRTVGSMQPRTVPVGAIFVGRYRFPCVAAHFAADLAAIAKGAA